MNRFDHAHHAHHCDDNHYPEYVQHGDHHGYLEHDYFAHEVDDQLPLISAMGAGPRGEGLTVKPVKQDNGEVIFNIVSTKTGEVVYRTPNLSAGELSFAVRGNKLFITNKKGINVTETELEIPTAERGSRVITTTSEPNHRNKVSQILTYKESDLDIMTEPAVVGDLLVSQVNNTLVLGTFLGTETLVDKEPFYTFKEMARFEVTDEDLYKEVVEMFNLAINKVESEHEELSDRITANENEIVKVKELAEKSKNVEKSAIVSVGKTYAQDASVFYESANPGKLSVIDLRFIPSDYITVSLESDPVDHRERIGVRLSLNTMEYRNWLENYFVDQPSLLNELQVITNESVPNMLKEYVKKTDIESLTKTEPEPYFASDELKEVLRAMREEGIVSNKVASELYYFQNLYAALDDKIVASVSNNTNMLAILATLDSGSINLVKENLTTSSGWTTANEITLTRLESFSDDNQTRFIQSKLAVGQGLLLAVNTQRSGGVTKMVKIDETWLKNFINKVTGSSSGTSSSDNKLQNVITTGESGGLISGSVSEDGTTLTINLDYVGEMSSFNISHNGEEIITFADNDTWEFTDGPLIRFDIDDQGAITPRMDEEIERWVEKFDYEAIDNYVTQLLEDVSALKNEVAELKKQLNQ